jgi:hypothetical protein
MSTQFRNPRHAFVKHDDVNLFGTDTTNFDHEAPKRKNSTSALCDRPPAPVRDGHIVLLAVDALVALHASIKRWRNYRRTLRTLADLDEDQLHDIGLTREEALPGRQSYRALAELNEVRRHSP